MKLDIKKNTEGPFTTDVYSGDAIRDDGYKFQFDIFQINLVWKTEYSVLSNTGFGVVEGVKHQSTMLDSFVWAADFFRTWQPDEDKNLGF